MKPPAPRHLCWISALILIIALAGHATSQYLASGFGEKYPAEHYFNPQTSELLHHIIIGHESAAKKQLDSGLTLNTEGKKFMTPLLWLILKKDKPAVLLALKLGADPNFRDSSGNTALYDIASQNLTDYMKILLDAGADPNIPGSDFYDEKPNKPPLMKAIGFDYTINNLKLLLSYGANINSTDRSGATPVHYALRLQLYAIALWLIQQGADIYPYDRIGSNLATEVQNTISLHNGNLKSVSPNVLKLKSLLIQRGVKFPPLTPFEVRAMWQAGKQPDDGPSPPGMVK